MNEVFGFQGGGGGGGLSSLQIENTLYVMKNGDDATGLRNRLDKPFLTINAASQAAVAGDTIYVFSGTFNEGANDVFLSDINYVLESGAIVETTQSTVIDGAAKNINILGSGILRCLNSNHWGIKITNSNSVVNITCDAVLSEGNGVQLSGQINVNINRIEALDGISVLFDQATAEGVLTIGSVLHPSNVNNVVTINQINQGVLFPKKLFLNFQKIESSSQGGIFFFNDNSETKIYLNVQYCAQMSNAVQMLSFNDTNVFINNSNFEDNSTGSAGILNQSTTGLNSLLVTNSNLKCDNVAYSSLSDTMAQINNTFLKSTANICVYLELGELTMYDCFLVGGDGTRASKVVYLNNNETTPVLRIKDCVMIDQVAIGASISSLNNCDIYVYGQSVTNVPTDSTITNLIAGTNIIVDSDVVQNTSNFF